MHYLCTEFAFFLTKDSWNQQKSTHTKRPWKPR